MTDRRPRLLAVLGLLAVLVLVVVAAVVVRTRGPGSDVASSPTTAAVPAPADDPATTIPTTATTPAGPTTSLGPVAPVDLIVEPSVDEAMRAAGSAPVIITMNLDPTGSDAERTATVRAGLDRMLADLPPGSWSAVRETGTLPIVTLTLAAAGLESLRASDLATVVSSNSIRTPSAESNLTPEVTYEPASAQSTTSMGAVASWAAGWTGAGSTVAVIDTGVQTNHPYLMRGSTPKTVAEACFVTPSFGWTSPCPGGETMLTTAAPLPGSAAPCPLSISSCKHGTHVAGIAVGGDGVSLPSGVAPGADLIAIQVFAYKGTQLGADDGDINASLQWLYVHHAQFPGLAAVNLSLGGGPKNTGYCDSNPTKAFIDQLLTIGVVTVIASGNSGYPDGVSSPGCISTAVTVGAVDGVPDLSASYSNDGPQVDLMAPGSNITSSLPGGAMGQLTGTSMATPAVTGSFAVMHGPGAAKSLERLQCTGYMVHASAFVIPSVRLGTAAAGKPCAPATVTAAPAVSLVAVSWTGAPTSLASAVSQYTVTASPGGATCTWSSGPLACTVAGLTAGTPYSFSVTATNGAGSGPPGVSSAVVIPLPPPTPGLNPLIPARLMDTRDPTPTNGVATVDGNEVGTGAITSGVVDSFQVTNRGGVPATGVGAVAVNVTVVSPSGPGYLTVFPSGSPVPNASNLNFVAGQTVANMVITKVGPDGRVAVVTNTGAAQVVADVVGWFASDPDYVPLEPARLMETRVGPGLTTFDHVDEGIGAIGPSATVVMPVVDRGGVPLSGVDAVVLNVTAVGPTATGYLTVFPTGSAMPNASNLNFTPGKTVPVMVIAKVGPDGSVSIFNNAGSTNLVIDVMGWIPVGSDYTALTPARFAETRPPGPGITTIDGVSLGTGAIGPGQSITVTVAGRGDVPLNGVSAVALNVTAVNPTASGYLTEFPSGSPVPNASNLNFVPGQTVANAVIATLGTGGRITIYNNAGSTDLIVDVVGWYA